jgi:phosphate transport system substrate-binding protein
MKLFSFLTILALSLTTVCAQQETGTVTLRGTRLTYPLVQRWIDAFKKEYPNITVAITPNIAADSLDFAIAAYSIVGKDLGANTGVAVARYVQLPVANSKRPDLAAWQERGFTEADFKNLYFTPQAPNFFASASASQPVSPITLYTRDKPACAAVTFAKHYDNDPKNIQGKGVKGDDRDLAKAVQDDVNGVSFNNLGFVYDVQTRRVTPGLAVIPLDLNENGHVDADENVYATLDDVIAYVERTNHPRFVTENINFLYAKDSKNKAAGIFLTWVLTKGQQYNHALGFLGLNATSVPACQGTDALMKQRKTKSVAP